jgi:hypothetical protein
VRLLESNYIKTEALGASGSMCDKVRASGDYRWNHDGKCQQISTGRLYPGDQKLSNCSCLGPPPATSGSGAVYNFLLRTFLPQPGTVGAPVMPESSFSPTSLMLPAVLVVGGIGLLLILKKKK